MPRMSKKRKQEWALFLNDRNRITYNELCRKWLWYPYIPFGKVTLLQGDSGDGKSKLMLSIVALLSNGEPRRRMLPDYGTVSMKGTQYYRNRVTDQQGRRVSLYARRL